MTRVDGSADQGLFSPWLLNEPDPKAKARLFVLPYLGAGASMYHGWRELADHVDICMVQLPGRETWHFAPPIRDYADFSGELVEALAPLLNVPFAFFGHCNAAYIAFEASRAAEEAGKMPAQLFISSMFAPDRAVEAPILRMDRSAIKEMARSVARRSLGEDSEELAEAVRAAIEIDLKAYRRYASGSHSRSETILGHPLTAISWDEDDSVGQSGLAEWRAYSNRTDLMTLPGDHWTFATAPFRLVAIIESMLRGDA